MYIKLSLAITWSVKISEVMGHYRISLVHSIIEMLILAGVLILLSLLVLIKSTILLESVGGEEGVIS